MNSLCQPDEDGNCRQCGRKIPLALTQCVATARWKKAGSPVRTQARLLEVLSICQGCPHIRAGGTEKQHCGVCGCSVNGWLTTSGNQLALATEACPLKPPRWAAEPGAGN